jgi:hypothetical protein
MKKTAEDLTQRALRLEHRGHGEFGGHGDSGGLAWTSLVRSIVWSGGLVRSQGGYWVDLGCAGCWAGGGKDADGD